MILLCVCEWVWICLWAQSFSHVQLWPHGLHPTRLLYSWEFSVKNTGMNCQFLCQGTFPTQGLNPHLLLWQLDSLPLSYLKASYVYAEALIYLYFVYSYDHKCAYIIYIYIYPFSRYAYYIFTVSIYAKEIYSILCLVLLLYIRFPIIKKP